MNFSQRNNSKKQRRAMEDLLEEMRAQRRRSDALMERVSNKTIQKSR